MFKRMLVAVTALATLFLSAPCVEAAKPDKWLIYWYVCGSDIETTNIAFGFGTDLMSDDPNNLFLYDPDKQPWDATRCINEVERATLSPNVKIFMQAGGAYVWGHKKFRDNNAKIQINDSEINKSVENTILAKGFRIDYWKLDPDLEYVANGKIGRYLYDKYHRNWFPLEQLPITGNRNPEIPNPETDMGSQAGLVSFLKAGQELERILYPDGNVRRVLIFFDHGVTCEYGLFGICKDDYTGNSLTLKNLQDAFAEVQSGWANPKEKPFEVIAFDACEMSTYETAVSIKDAANYMVASQEPVYCKVMLGYTGLLNELSKKPSMSGEELSKIICKTYWEDSKATDKEFGFKSNEILTSSVVDLSESKMNALKTAYENFGMEARNFAWRTPEEFAKNFVQFKKAVSGAEKYPSSNYSAPPFVDLKGFAENVKQNIPELSQVGGALVSAIDNAVIYQKRGETLNRGGGLSIYYPFNLLESEDNISAYQNYAAVDGLAPEAQGELYANLYNAVTQRLSDFDLSDLKNVAVKVGDNNRTLSVELNEAQLQKIEGVRCRLMYVKLFGDELRGLYLGSTGSVQEKRGEGKFVSNFRGKWLMINNQLVWVQVISDSTKKNKAGKKVDGTELCVVPILINNQESNLFISCKYPKEKFTVVGIANPDDKSGIPSGDLKGLERGDVVTPRYLVFSFSREEMENVDEKAQRMYGKSFDELTEEEKVALNEDLFGFVNGTPITVGYEPLKIEMGTLPDGNYAYIFDFVNPLGGDSVSADEIAIFKIKDGKIAEVKTSINEEDLRD